MTIVQEDITGCGIASVANIVELPYKTVMDKANSLGIFVDDEALFSDTKYVRKVLREYNIQISITETPFKSWKSLPDLALLSIKHYTENNRHYWHWVVFKREQGNPFVLDSAAYLKNNERTDFNAMKPEWYIEVLKATV
ncbi:MAG: hypothetical protein KZQ83_17550 [gamma proteobacterium symbiont of Taylorina sp.]|nr:hypothetical protein [gamma proteobacterium symbiont of Taylorina sp.]